MATPEVSVDLTKTLENLASLCKATYEERLVSLAVFGSVGRGTPRPDSDIDILLIANGLPNGRIARVREFAPIEVALDAPLNLSPFFKTPEEIANGSPLFLDMIEDVRLLFDRDNYFRNVLNRLNERLQKLGAQRIWQADAWYWDLNPNYKPGEVFEI